MILRELLQTAFAVIVRESRERVKKKEQDFDIEGQFVLMHKESFCIIMTVTDQAEEERPYESVQDQFR